MAGANAAFALRKLGFEGRVVIVGEENGAALRATRRCRRTTCAARRRSRRRTSAAAPTTTAENIELLSRQTATAIDVEQTERRLDDGGSH